MSSAAAQRPVLDDPTIYPVTDDTGVPTLQTFISILLFSLLRRWFASRGKPIFVGANQFFYWKQFDATERVAPAVYLLPGVPLTARVGAWKVWETGHVPSFAFEVVSHDVDKDYLVVPRRYGRLGVKELFVFDPDFATSPNRARWQVFRRVKGRGLLRVEATNGDRVRSRAIGCFLRAVGEGDEVRVRLATGPTGDTLFLTDEEDRAQAEAELAQLRAELARSKKRRG
jgi:Uma2 family endonuclease